MRIATSIGAAALLAQVLFLQGCGSNDPATNAGAAGNSGTPATSAPVAGSTTPATTAGAAGTTGSTASTAAAGGVSGGTEFQPLCGSLKTAAGEVPSKGVTCAAASDPQLCYKTCGPESKGFKTETCVGGAYAEGKTCEFPKSGDYACYKVPATISATCPATTPQASQPCTVDVCTLCNFQGSYSDSGGATKTGYCVCPESSTGTRKWSCASDTAWPCPNPDLKGC